jgi:flagellar assembly protein FliH
MQRLTADLLQTHAESKVLGKHDSKPAQTIDTKLNEAQKLRDQEIYLFEQTKKRGLAEGLKDAESEIEARVEEIKAGLTRHHQKALDELNLSKRRFDDLSTSLKSSIAQYADDAEAMAVEIAFASVLRLLGDKSTERTLMKSLCRVVANDYGHGVATLRVSEQDREHVQLENVDIEIEVDRRLKAGQCVIETSRGQFESGIDVRLDALKKVFLSTLAQHRENE